MDPITYAGLWQFSDLFCAHTDAYVKNSKAHVNEPITPELLVDAYTNKWSVSGYTARLVNGSMVTHVGAIDFDHTEELSTMTVRDSLTKLGIPSLLSQSRRGAHLWVVCHDVGPAAWMRHALEHAIRLTQVKVEEVEVFPKASDKAFGVGALRMPLMTHPKTGDRYPVWTLDGARLTKITDVVEAAQYTEWSTLKALAVQAPVEYPRGLGVYRKVTDYGDQGSAVSMLADLGVQARAGHGCRCPFHDDAHASLSVAEDDQRVWCKAPDCVAYNGGRGVGTLALAKIVREIRGA